MEGRPTSFLDLRNKFVGNTYYSSYVISRSLTILMYRSNQTVVYEFRSYCCGICPIKNVAN